MSISLDLLRFFQSDPDQCGDKLGSRPLQLPCSTSDFIPCFGGEIDRNGDARPNLGLSQAGDSYQFLGVFPGEALTVAPVVDALTTHTELAGQPCIGPALIAGSFLMRGPDDSHDPRVSVEKICHGKLLTESLRRVK